MKKSLQNLSSKTLYLIKVSKPIDLLKARSIDQQIELAGFNQVLNYVVKAVVKVGLAMGIEINPIRVKFLAEELIDINQDYSLEDIQQALQKGRRGEFELGYAKRGVINMELLSSWMKEQQIHKGRLREVEKQNSRKCEVEKGMQEMAEIYEEMRKGIIKSTGKKPSNFIDDEYQKFKDERNKKNDSNDSTSKT